MCRYHEQFFAFSESMTDSALDAGDYLCSDDNPTPSLSVVYGTGESWLREELPLPVSLRDRSRGSYNCGERDGSIRLLRQHLKRHPDLTVGDAIAFLKTNGIHLAYNAVSQRLLQLGHKYSARYKGSRALPIVKQLLASDPAIRQAEAIRVLKQEHGIQVGTTAMTRYFRQLGQPVNGCRPNRGASKLPRFMPLLTEELKSKPDLTYREIIDRMRSKHSLHVSSGLVAKAFSRMGISRAHFKHVPRQHEAHA